MSLDVYLRMGETVTERWCDHCGEQHSCREPNTVYSANITHNLGKMADEAGIYGIVWRPEENGVETAGDLVEPLRAAIEAMEKDPPRFERHNSPNGWGLYENFLPWLKRYMAACEDHPKATVYACR